MGFFVIFGAGRFAPIFVFIRAGWQMFYRTSKKDEFLFVFRKSIYFCNMSERDYIQSFSEYLFWDVDKLRLIWRLIPRMWLEEFLNLDNSAAGISWSGDMVFHESLRLLKIFVPLIPRRFLLFRLFHPHLWSLFDAILRNNTPGHTGTSEKDSVSRTVCRYPACRRDGIGSSDRA